ncbi:MAG: transposase [Phycisphaerales bacterium]
MKKLRRRIEKVKGLCVGLDLHKRFIQVGVLDEQGDEIMAEQIASNEQAVRALIDRMSASGQPGPVSVAMEASGCFTGLTPGYRASGGRVQKKKIAREGSSHVRWALTRAVLACSRCKHGPGVSLWQWVMKMSRRKPKKAAMVAAARKLAEGVWRLFAWGEQFDLRRMFPA